MTTNLRHAVGSLLVVGLSGQELTGLERAWLKLVRPAGIILFKRNVANRAQTRTLLSDATSLCAPHSLRCVDVEGGTVDRLRDALAPMPSAQAVAQKVTQTGRYKLIREQGELIARGVKAFGFNTTLAPVLDLGLPASASVMGTRCAASTSEGVIQYTQEFLAGLALHGVVGCGKHFPGLGGSTLDSHAETPSIERSFDQLWREDLAPYREPVKQLPMIMVNHAAYPKTHGADEPASVSKFWITTVLRQQIGYRGLVFSDDMEMGGILKFMPIEEAAVASGRAGMDLIEICHSPELILRAFEALIAEAERSAAFRNLVIERARDSSRKRAKLFRDEFSPALSAPQFEALRKSIVLFGEAIGAASPSLEGERAATNVESV